MFIGIGLSITNLLLARDLTPGGAADALLLENGVDGLLLEDGSGVLLLE